MSENITQSPDSPRFDVLTNDNIHEPDTIRCYKSDLIGVENMTIDDLFNGFDEIRIITFSYDIPMIGWLMQRFQYGEILIGADFMVKKDSKAASWLAEYLTTAEDTAQQVRKYDNLLKMMLDGNLVVHTSTAVIDHRKMYLLRSDDGRTRVIITSANMTKRAWSSEQMENFIFYDGPEVYESFLKEFNTAWDMAVDIPYEVVTVNETDDPKKANAVIKKIMETQEAVVFQAPDCDEQTIINNYEYTLRVEDTNQKYLTFTKNIGLRKKDGMIMVKPNHIKKVEANIKKERIKRAEVHTINGDYPTITFDYDNQAMLLSDKESDLHPSEADVQANIRDLLLIFDKYNSFVGTTLEKQQNIYYKLLNAMFASPFFARLRCEARLINKGTTSLPLFLLLASSHASTGKSFFVKAILKMMTGKRDLPALPSKEYPASEAAKLQAAGAGVPFFIDEIDNTYLSNMAKHIKTPENICEMRQHDNVPMLIFASNKTTDPDMTLRKRMIFLDPEGTIPADADQTAWLSAGNSLIARLGDSLYREYVRRMIPKVWSLIETMMGDTGKELPDDWYPDIMPLSSETLIQIMQDFGFEIPHFFRRLTWKDDFAENAAYITADAYREIWEMYETSPNMFTIKKNTVKIEMSQDKENKKKFDSWNAVLPVEVIKRKASARDGITIVFDRTELEKRGKIQFKTHWWERWL